MPKSVASGRSCNNRHERIPIEEIDAHAGQEWPIAKRYPLPFDVLGRRHEWRDLLIGRRLLDESGHLSGVIDADDAEAADLFARHRQHGDRNVGLTDPVRSISWRKSMR